MRLNKYKEKEEEALKLRIKNLDKNLDSNDFKDEFLRKFSNNKKIKNLEFIPRPVISDFDRLILEANQNEAFARKIKNPKNSENFGARKSKSEKDFLEIEKKDYDYSEEKIKKPEIKKLSEQEVEKCAKIIKKMKEEIGKALIGQEDIVDGLITGLLCNAHILLEGVPGIAKTLAIRVLGKVSGCEVNRIQFTVDMLPADIIGITSYTPEKGFETIKGPIFANFLIADEINRAPPKTQSALMEGMQERQVTIGKKDYPLPSPFFVMATENPIENAGVYPLPEAQVDRFLFKLLMGYPKEDEERIIMESNMTLTNFEDFNIKAVTSPKEIIEMQEVVKKVYLDENIKSYILKIVRKTREKNFKNSDLITYGTSPRATIGLFIASKAKALIQGRNYVLPEDVKKVAFDVLRHRLILSYKAIIQKVGPDQIIQEILDSIKVE